MQRNTAINAIAVIVIATQIHAPPCAASDGDDQGQEQLLLDLRAKARGQLIAGIIHLVGGSLWGVGAIAGGVITLKDIHDCQWMHRNDDIVCDESGLGTFAAELFAYAFGISAIAHLLLGAVLTASGAIFQGKKQRLEQGIESAIPQVSFSASPSGEVSLGMRWTF